MSNANETNPYGHMRATFFRDDVANRDMVQVDMVGEHSNIIRKVRPADVEAWPLEWKAYRDKTPDPVVEGTPLTDVPGVDRVFAGKLRFAGVRVAEELADLTDGQCNNIGFGVITARDVAKLMIAANGRKDRKASEPERRGPGRPRKDESVEAAA